MAMNLIYLKVLAIALAIQWIPVVSSATQTQIYPLFTASNAISGKAKSTPSKVPKEPAKKSLITIKPALLRASSLTSFRNSLLKKPHLTLFNGKLNKPSSIAFLNKKYLPQSLELLFSTPSGSSSGTGDKSKRLPTYHIATPIGSSLLGSTPSLIETANLKGTGTDKLQFITKPLFIPINGFGGSDNSQLKKLGSLSSWNSLLSGYGNFNGFNAQLSSGTKTNLPVFVFSSEKYNFNQDKFNFDENKYHNQNNKFQGEQSSNQFNEKNSQKPNNAVRNPQSQPQHPNAIQDVPFYSNSNDVNQTNSMKGANYKPVKQPQFSHDFKPIVGGANSFRTGRTIGFDKGQIRQQSFINEVKSPDPPKFDSAKLVLANNMDLELIDRNMDRNILNTIEKDIKLNNIRFIKSIIFPKKDLKLDEKVKAANVNNNRNVKPIDKGNQLIHGNNQMSHNINLNNLNNNLNNNNYQNDHQVNHNGQMNNLANPMQNSAQNFQQQQSVQHVLKMQSSNMNGNANGNMNGNANGNANGNSNGNNYDRSPDKQVNSVNNPHMNTINKEDRPESSSPAKMPKFKIIQYADKGAIEEFTRALENIDFKSITQNDLAGLPEFVYDKLGNARIETIMGHRENNQQNGPQGGQQSNQQGQQHNQGGQQGGQQGNYIMAKETNNNDYKEKSSGSFQAPPQMQFFASSDKINSNDCAKNRKLRQMNSNGPPAGGYQGNQQMNQQANYQPPMNQQPMNQQPMNQQSNYQQQQGSSSQQKSYFNDQSNSITLNSLVNFDDQASFYSTSSTKLRQLKVLPNSDQISPVISSSSSDNQFSPVFGNSLNGAGQLDNSMSNQIGNQMGNSMNNQAGNLMSRSQSGNQQSGQSNQQSSHSNQQSNQQSSQHSPSGQPNNHHNELNDEFKKEINDDESDQFDKKPVELDIETGDDSAADQLDNLDGVSKKLNSVAGSGETTADSLDPTKLDLKIIHLPVSVLKKLVAADGKKRRKK